MRHRVHLTEKLVSIEHRAGAVGGGDLLGARPVGVDDRRELDARQRRQDPRVMLAEMPDADDRDAKRHRPNHEGTKTTKTSTKKHEKSLLRVIFVSFVSSWFG